MSEVSWSLFNTEAEAHLALGRLWVHSLRAIAAAGDGTLIDIRSGLKVPAEMLTDGELLDRSRFPVMGRKGDKLNKTDGFSTAWAPVYSLTAGDCAGMFGFPSSPDEEAAGVIPAAVEPFCDSWEPEALP